MNRFSVAKRFYAIFLITASIMFLSPAPAAFSAKASEKDEWILEQVQYGTGPHRVYLATDAIKIVNELGDYYLVAKAPTWRTVVFRPKDKIGCQYSLEEAFRGQNFLPLSPDKSGLHPHGESGCTVNGVKITKFTNQSGGIWVIDGINVAPQSKNLLLAFYHAVAVDGVLYRYYVGISEEYRREYAKTWHTALKNESKVADIVTTSRVSKVKYNPADFEYPASFTPATLQQVITSSKQTKSWGSLINDMKVGEKFAKP